MSGDRAALIEESRQELNFVLNNWDQANLIVLGTFLATDWRLLLQNYGNPDEISKATRTRQLQCLNWLLGAETKMDETLSIARSTRHADDQIFELICQKLSLKFLANFVIAIIEDDTKWEVELAPKLDLILEVGWAISLSSFPLDLDQNYLSHSDPSTPYERFQRY